MDFVLKDMKRSNKELIKYILYKNSKIK